MRHIITIIITAIVLISASTIQADTIAGDRISLTYTDKAQLEAFNDKVYLKQLRKRLADHNSVEGEVLDKLHVILDAARETLELPVPDITFSVVLLDNTDEVSSTFAKKYHNHDGLKGYYDTKENVVYLSVSAASFKVTVHEIAHAIIEHHYTSTPPTTIHEHLAQFVEKELAW